MRLPHARAFALALACFLLISFAARAGEKATPPRVAYEYKVVSDPDIVTEGRLNELGAQGWEFVQIQTVPGRGSAAYFKRVR